MTGEREDATQLSEVLRLIGSLSDAVLDAQIMERPVPPAQVRALTDAARLLREHDIALPPMLVQVLHEFDRTAPRPTDDVDADALEPTDRKDAAKGFARLLQLFRNYRS